MSKKEEKDKKKTLNRKSSAEPIKGGKGSGKLPSIFGGGSKSARPEESEQTEDNSNAMASDSEPTQGVQQDWENREMLATLSADMQRIAAFLNKFEISVRDKLEQLNNKLIQLERTVDYLEARYFTVEHPKPT